MSDLLKEAAIFSELKMSESEGLAGLAILIVIGGLWYGHSRLEKVESDQAAVTDKLITARMENLLPRLDHLEAQAALSSSKPLADPQTCLIEASKGDHASQANDLAMVRYACIRKYINYWDKNGVNVPVSKFTKSYISWFPAMGINGYGQNEHVDVSILNESDLDIVSATVVIVDKKDGAKTRVYTLHPYVDGPISPHTAGRMTADSILATEMQKTGKGFWDSHDWGLASIKAVPASEQ